MCTHVNIRKKNCRYPINLNYNKHDGQQRLFLYFLPEIPTENPKFIYKPSRSRNEKITTLQCQSGNIRKKKKQAIFDNGNELCTPSIIYILYCTYLTLNASSLYSFITWIERQWLRCHLYFLCSVLQQLVAWLPFVGPWSWSLCPPPLG